jgi:hypothetical protein
MDMISRKNAGTVEFLALARNENAMSGPMGAEEGMFILL